MADPRDVVQSALLGRYDVVTHLATGGMAEVYLARDCRHSRDVALKIVREELAAVLGPERFLREIAITARLSHPNIRPLLDSGEANGLLFYSMPFIRGETLRDQIRREGSLGLDDALSILRDMADALDYAHAQGVVHRDVKPGNIFLESNHAQLSDFGIAVMADKTDVERLTDSGVVIGTPEYLSPEQCDGRMPVDGRSDIYGLGCVLFEMLTGQPPFTGKTRLAIIARQMGEAAPSAAILRPDLPVEVEELLQRCLAKTPSDRFANAAALRDATDRTIGVLKAGLSRGTVSASRQRRAIRRRRSATIGSLALLSLAVLLWRGVAAGPPPLDVDKVLVFPLIDRIGTVDPAGAAVAMMIGNALLHADPLKAIDAWDYLTAEQRGNPALLTQEERRQIAIDRRAAFFITGGLVRQRDTISVSLTLHDARGDSILSQASFRAASIAMSSDQIGVRALVDLLPSLVEPGREVEMNVVVDRDPAASYLWIRGDLDYRNARFSAALEHYRAAVNQDSLLIYAALKGAQAASWSERPELAVELANHAVANDSILPVRHRFFARGLLAYFEGRADDASREFRNALEQDPAWSEAWMALGEVYQHLLPSDLADTISANDFFERALTHDPDFVPALVHLSQHAVRTGQVQLAADLVRRLREPGTGTPSFVAVTTLVQECIERGPDREAWAAAARTDLEITLEAAQQLAVGALHDACAVVAFRSLLDQAELPRNIRGAVTIGLQSILVAQGRDAEAQDLLHEQLALGLSTVRYLPALDVLAGADLDAAAREVEAFADSAWGPSYAGVSARLLWLVGTWKLHVGDTIAGDTIVRRVEEIDAEGSSEHTRLIAGILRARTALHAGDSASALLALRSLTAAGTRPELRIGLYEGFPAERILLAELLLASGDPEEAWRVAATLDHPQPLLFPAFVPKSLGIRYRAALAIPGIAWRNRADEARRRLERLGRSDLLPTESERSVRR